VKSKYQKSTRRERELIAGYRKKGIIASRLNGADNFDLVAIDTLCQTVTLVTVRAKKGSSFRIDRDEHVHPGWTLLTKRVTYDGKVFNA
jgi:Holliday junction resolvase